MKLSRMVSGMIVKELAEVQGDLRIQRILGVNVMWDEIRGPEKRSPSRAPRRRLKKASLQPAV